MKIIILSLLIILGFSTNLVAQKVKFTKISGKNIQTETVYLSKITKNKGEVIVDSSKIINGKFKIKIDRSQLDLYILEAKPNSSKQEIPLILILDKDSKKVKIKGDSIISSSKVKGSEYTQDFSEFMDFKNELDKKMEEQIDVEAMYSGDSTVIDAIIKEIDSFSLTEFNYAVNYIEKKPESLVSLFMLSSIYKNDIRTDKMYSNLSYFKIVHDGISNKYPDSPFLLIINDYKEGVQRAINRNSETILEGYNNFKEEKVNNGSVAKVKEENFLFLTDEGKVPEISLKNPNGEIIKLSSLRGQVVFIDFWASWCRPCRKENPNVVANYEKFKDQGFTVYSVSLDENKANWEKAIEQDNLYWVNHVSDLKGWNSSAATLYNIKSIPSSFLIDKEGKLIGVNLRGQALEQKLIEVFKK